MHRLRLLLLRLPIRRAAISAGRQFWFARQDGQMHLLRWRRRIRSRRQCRGVCEIRLEQVRPRQAADVRRDVLHQVVAGGRRRRHCANLQGARLEAGLRLRCLGLDHRLSRGYHGLSGSLAVTGNDVMGERLIVMTLFLRIRPFIVTAALLIFAAVAVAQAQKLGPDGAPNPTASVVDQATMLKRAPRIEGSIDIPDRKASVLVQPAGRKWDYFHEVLLHWGGAVVIVGMTVLLGLAYLIIGRVPIAAGRSGQKVLRFKAFERFSHWLTAASFVVLGLTGLNITFGKIVLLPLVGPDTFSDIAEAAKYVHNFTSFAFVLGLVLIIAIFFRDNLPEKVDVEWLKQGGGFIKNKHASAGRFNLGEKLVYWLSLVAGVAVSLSGFLLLFPFFGTNIADMQVAQVVHAVVAVLFVALILGHIYIGTLGMEGAFEAMGTGEVDLNWAKEHHDLWLAQQLADKNRQRQPSAAPAE